MKLNIRLLFLLLFVVLIPKLPAMSIAYDGDEFLDQKSSMVPFHLLKNGFLIAKIKVKTSFSHIPFQTKVGAEEFLLSFQKSIKMLFQGLHSFIISGAMIFHHISTGQ